MTWNGDILLKISSGDLESCAILFTLSRVGEGGGGGGIADALLHEGKLGRPQSARG